MFAKRVLAFGIVAVCGFAQQWTPELQMKVKLVGDVVPSPDGQMVAWTQTRAVMETEKSEQVTEVFLAHADGTDRKLVGRGGSIAWSPDSRSVFYQSGRIVWRVAFGADAKDPEAILDWKGSIGTYAISPSGKMLAFTGLEPDLEAERARKEKRDWKVIGANPRNAALWAVLIGASSRPTRISSTPRHVGSFSWSPDSRSIAFETRPTPEANLASRSDIAEVEIATKTEKPIASTIASESQPRYSADGKYLAFVRSALPVQSAGDDHIVLHPRDGRPERNLPDTYDRLPKLLGWSGDSILFEEGRGTRNAIYAMPIDGPPKLVYAPPGVLSAYRLNDTATALGFVRESSSEAPEAFVRPVGQGDPVRVSAANTDLPALPIGETKVLWWRSKDNTEVEGLLTLPVGYVKGTKVPTVMLLHGGPYGANMEQFLGRPGLYPLATFSSRGYAVFRPNPRASTGYGRDFRFLNLKDWGGGDYDDVMTGMDLVIRDGVADPNKLAVMGWSYGGYLTSWTISHTNRFKAAAVGAGVENLISQTGNADIRNNKIDAFGAPWDNRAYYIERSPITHVKNVTTPTLILGGEQDDRVPLSQSFELYHALEARGVETQMVAYPRTPHGPREPKFQLDIMQRHLDWVEKHVR
ncbi:MAG: S9 family peptidase [Bryobacteraceae bacterium]